MTNEGNSTAVSQEAILQKLMDHETKITRAEGKIDRIVFDVHSIKEDITPISRGVTTMVHLFKLAIGIGMLVGVVLGIFEFIALWDHTHD
jgi:hypothetical protein